MSAILFMIASVAYMGAAFAAHCETVPHATRRRRGYIAVSARALALGAIGVHLAGLIVRGIHADRLPIQNQYESMTGVALMSAVAGWMVSWFVVGRATDPPTTSTPNKAGSAKIAGLVAAALLLAAAHGLGVPGQPIEPEAPILSTASLLKFHVTIVIAGYGLSAVGGLLGLAWIVMKSRREAMAEAGVIAARLAFWVLGVGILLGAWWAHRAWGRWWAFDAKETWALILWSVYFVPVHASAVGGIAAARTVAWSNVIAMLVMLWSYFGVNLLLVSLHSYA